MIEKLNNKHKRQGVSGGGCREELENNKVCQSRVNL